MKFGPSSDRAADRQEGTPTMAARKVTKDPKHPDFPHGTTRGRSRGCDCSKCTLAERRRRKASQLEAARNGGQYPNRLVDATPVREHLQRLLDSDQHTCASSLSRAVGGKITSVAITNLVSGRTLRVRKGTADALLALTEASVRAHNELVPRDQAVTAVRAMQALGYPLDWQARHLGYAPDGNSYAPRFIYDDSRRREFIQAGTARKVFELAAQVGDTPATPGTDGLTAFGVNYARRTARALGYYPPACYDADWNLDPRAVEDHPWARADRRAEQRIEVLRRFTDPDRPAGNRIAKEVGCSVRTVDRYAADLGLNRSEPGVSDRERVKELRPLVFAYDDGDVDPVYLAISLGMLERSNNVPSDHPGVMQWDQEQEEKRRQAGADLAARLAAGLHAAALDLRQPLAQAA